MGSGGETLPALLREAQGRFAQRPAILHRGVSTTYGELWRQVLRAANVLRALGLQPGDRVALWLENSVDYVVAYYAAMEAGAVVVALNTALRDAELQWRMAHCGALVLVTGAQAMPTRPATSAASWRVVSPAELLAGDDERDPGLVAGSDAPAAILYTSGTTTDPRGVTLSHRNLVANTRSILDYLQLTEADRVVNVLPFHYSYGNSVLHTHLAAGASIVLENSLLYPHLVVQQIADTAATGFSGVPSTYALLLQRVKLAEFGRSSLRWLTQAGGAMAPAHLARLREALPQTRVFVMYGQTEATARISYLPPERLDDKPGSVGIAIPGVTIEVRDERGARVATGMTGEVCVRGANVMLGYWENPTATAKVLRNGCLHTGDLGRLDEEGFLTLVGRSSDMIKTGAHRVSPLEVEAAVLLLGEVADCAVVGVPDEILGEVIAAHIVMREGAVLDARRVQAHCRDRLATYMIPKTVHFAESLPKTASGKVQRYLLKGPQ
jgi:acyl-CoA synthetase (AMP-forming)/AMP-acid ligase II